LRPNVILSLRRIRNSCAEHETRILRRLPCAKRACERSPRACVTIAVKDPTGTVVASGTVQDGVLALQFGAHGIRVYTIDVGDPTGGQVDFDLWDIVESR